MNDHEFDRALIGAAFALAAERGWRNVTVAEAARRADLKLDRARARFPARGAIVLRFGLIADQEALAAATGEGSHRDRLFDLLMRRYDALQPHREGILALMRYLRCNPGTALLLAAAHRRSMTWMLDAADIPSRGPLGRLRAKGLLAVWLAGLRAWREDASEDLTSTMAALDRALSQAERAEAWFGRRGSSAPAGPPPDMPPADMPPPDVPPSDMPPSGLPPHVEPPAPA